MDEAPTPPTTLKSLPTNTILTIISLASLVLSGFFLYQNWLLNQKIQRLIASQTPSVTPTPTPSVANPPLAKDPTADWKTYSNTKLGFSFKYPQDWTIEKSEIDNNNQSFLRLGPGKTKTPQPLLTITTRLTKTDQTLNQFRDSLIDPKDALLDGSPALKGQSDTDNSFITYAIKNTYVYTIGTVLDSTVPEIELTYDQILSTFKFTDKNSVEDSFCGGIAGIPCPSGYKCLLDGNYPDAGGTCQK